MLTEQQAEAVVGMLCRAMDCSDNELRGHSNKSALMGIRCRATQFLRDCGMSQESIGDALYRCHTTVFHRLQEARKYPPVILPPDEAELVTKWVTDNGGKAPAIERGAA